MDVKNVAFHRRRGLGTASASLRVAAGVADQVFMVASV